MVLEHCDYGGHVCFCSSVSLRLLTMVRVSHNRHRVNTCTLVSADSLASPERIEYDVHWALHASKSVPRSTWMSSLGRSVCWKMYVISTGCFISTWTETTMSLAKFHLIRCLNWHRDILWGLVDWVSCDIWNTLVHFRTACNTMYDGGLHNNHHMWQYNSYIYVQWYYYLLFICVCIAGVILGSVPTSMCCPNMVVDYISFDKFMVIHKFTNVSPATIWYLIKWSL